MTTQFYPAETLPRRSLALSIGALLGAAALAALDGNIVAAALPVIASELHDLTSLSWVITSFMLAQCASLLLYGKLSDMYGRRPLFLFAVSTFLIGSAACAFAHTMLQLILLRAVQGIGAAGILTLASVSVADLVSPRERGKYQSYFMATFAASSIAGPLVGGAITTYLGWRWVFAINLPLGLVVLPLLAWTLPRGMQRHSHDIDYPGALLVIISTFTGLLALSWGGGRFAWSSAVVLGLAATSALAVTALIAWERRAAEPVLDLSLFRDRVFTTCQLTNALVAFPFFGAVVYLPLYLQLVRGFDPARAGLIVVPQLIGSIVASFVGGRIVSRVGRCKPFITVGVAINGCSLFAIGALVYFGAPLGFVMLGLLTLGIGGGLCMPNITVAVQDAVSRAQLGAATAFTSFSNAVAAAAGIGTSGAILTGRVHAYITARAAPGAVTRLFATGVYDIRKLSGAERAIIKGAYSNAVSLTFLTGGLLVALSVAISLFIPNRELSRQRPHPGQALD